MDADLDTLCTVVYCTADDLLPEARRNARRRISDAELVTLCVAQAIMGIPSDRRFLAVARKRLVHLFPRPAQPARLPEAPPPAGRRDRVAHGRLRQQSPGFHDDLLLSTRPRWSAPEAVRRPSARRSARPPATATVPPTRAGSGAFACTCWPLPTARRGPSRWPIPRRGEREVALELLERCTRAAAQCSSATRATPGATSPPRPQSSACSWCGPRARTSPARVLIWRRSASASSRSSGPAKDLLTLERHGARTLAGLRERILQRFLCLAACISLNHRLGRPSRALVDYCA